MTLYQRITFVIPCRNNLKYLQQALNSIETHYKDEHDVVILDDASTDNSWQWIQAYASNKTNIITYRNEGDERVGHTVLYDIGFDLAKTPVVSILHSDMIVTPNYVQNMLKHLTPLSVVSATRVEPPLHPPGPEKYVRNFGLEPEEFSKQYDSFIKFVQEEEWVNKDVTTNGIFAPWMMYKIDFSSIGGHDKLFAPMELEDSDIFNRFHLKGYNLIQSRDAMVYHMTCRGSRFKDGIEIEKEIPLPDGTIWYKPKDSEEYLKLRQLKFREWWRKWHTDVLHDDLMMPIVPKRYDTTFIVTNCNQNILSLLEPWCDRIYVDCDFRKYIEFEENISMFEISKKINHIGNNIDGDVVIKFDATKLSQDHLTQFIKNIPFVIEETNQLGNFNWDIFDIEIKSLRTKDMVVPFFKNIF
jgi:glycosyltransferase involved in cell wall biosynthesis